ncbi:hypothetical protein AN958_11111 [Leucoagaricus sp. SymC.cos]|nr:hypothetical protein AN958_01038 [Leucoagaricus sp. SymC.cos]KXN85603.1 hypothetical protein AN958_11111 [Leucoagaricus sp. SymC.cos]
MTRYELQDGNICVAYGCDDVLGCFLSVQDSRLMWKKGESKDVNDIAQELGIGDGGGWYFNLTTGLGIGKRVSRETMAVFMKRFGIPQNHVNAVRQGAEF